MNELEVIDEDVADEQMDVPARDALLQSVLLVANRVKSKHGLALFMGAASAPFNTATAAACIPWKLVEILCALIVLDEAEAIASKQVFNLAGKVATPIEFTRNGRQRFLWIQHSMKGEQSGYRLLPDLVVTDSSFAPNSENVTEIIECKHRKNLDAVTIRSEFAKGYDLGVESYLIWSYFEVRQSVRDGAKRLGVEIKTIGLDMQERGALLNPQILTKHIADGVKNARENSLFATTLTRTSREAQEKLTRDARQP
jgi:hypothetical protein